MRTRIAAVLLAWGACAAAHAHGEGVGFWREQLRSSDPRARFAAAQGLGLTGSQAAPAVGDLIAALDDPDAAVRGEVVHALQDIGQPAVGAALPLARRLAVEPEPDVVQAIGRALIRMTSGARGAIPAVADALHAADPTARRVACNVIGDVGGADETVVDALVETMVRDPDSRVRHSARGALNRLGIDLSLHADDFVAAMRDPSPEVRATAADWLSEVRPRPVEAIDPLLTTLFQDDSLRVREAAGRTLRDFGLDAGSAVPRLLDAMRSGSREQRESAAGVLGAVSTGEDRDIDALVVASTHDTELSVRLAARGALVRLARTNAEVFDRFVQAAASGPSTERRTVLIDVLGRLGEVAAPAVPSLLVALREGTEDVREAAAKALGRVGAPASDALLPLKRVAAWDRSQNVRDAADRAIKGIRRAIGREHETAERGEGDEPAASRGR